jgi:hypothetical protein
VHHHSLQIHLGCMDFQSPKYRSDDDARVHRRPTQQRQLMLHQEMDDLNACRINTCLLVFEKKCY